MVEYINGDRAYPPPELELGWNMEIFGGLPEVGGMLDQSLALMKKIRIALNTYNVWKEYLTIPAGSQVEWITKNKDRYEIVKSIKGLLDNG